jgi:hypothetical protein
MGDGDVNLPGLKSQAPQLPTLAASITGDGQPPRWEPGHSVGPLHEGSAMGKVYRHTTPDMLARVVAAVEDRLAIALDHLKKG